MSYIDSRDLIEKREELKQEVLDSFLEEFPRYDLRRKKLKAVKKIGKRK